MTIPISRNGSDNSRNFSIHEIALMKANIMTDFFPDAKEINGLRKNYTDPIIGYR